MDKLYCISLKNEPIRRNLMINQLDKYFKNQYEIIDAITIEEPNGFVEMMYNNITLPKSNITALSQVAICYSHLECLEKIYENKYTFGGIIEDDIRLRDNFNEKINIYLKNTPTIVSIMKTEPCIIHICGPYNVMDKIYHFKEYRCLNICFYIINYQLAKILIDNFYPIKSQFDTYVLRQCRNMNIKEFTAFPILAWDLSSTLYNHYWDDEDIKIHKTISTTSNIKKVTQLGIDIKPNIYISKKITLYDKIFDKILKKNKCKITNNDIIHYASPSLSFADINDKSIIGGNGIKTLNDDINHPFYIHFIRGKITEKKIIEKSIEYNKNIYLEPLLLYSPIQNVIKKSKISPIVTIASKYKYCIYTNDDINISIKNINISKMDLHDITNEIKQTEFVITDQYEIMIIGNIMKKKIIPINKHDGDIRYLDYLSGYNNINIEEITKTYELLTLEYIINNINNKIPLTFQQINYSDIIEKQNKLKEILTYI